MKVVEAKYYSLNIYSGTELDNEISIHVIHVLGIPLIYILTKMIKCVLEDELQRAQDLFSGITPRGERIQGITSLNATRLIHIIYIFVTYYQEKYMVRIELKVLLKMLQNFRLFLCMWMSLYLCGCRHRPHRYSVVDVKFSALYDRGFAVVDMKTEQMLN